MSQRHPERSLVREAAWSAGACVDPAGERGRPSRLAERVMAVDSNGRRSEESSTLCLGLCIDDGGPNSHRFEPELHECRVQQGRGGLAVGAVGDDEQLDVHT